jgi:hypothetical protein
MHEIDLYAGAALALIFAPATVRAVTVASGGRDDCSGELG